MELSCFSNLKNYSYQRAYCFFDYMVVALLFGTIGNEGIPTGIIMASLFLVAVFLKMLDDSKFPELSVPIEFDILRNDERFEAVDFRRGLNRADNAHVRSFLVPYFVILPKSFSEESDDFIISTIAHERVHANLHDTITTFIYTRVSLALMMGATLGVPLFYFLSFFNLVTPIDLPNVLVFVGYCS